MALLRTLTDSERSKEPLFAWHDKVLWLTDERHECLDCDHKSSVCAETYGEMPGDDFGEDEPGTIRCPACLSWYYVFADGMGKDVFGKDKESS